MASGGVVRDFGGVRALPTSFLLDREGRVRHEVRGFFAELALEQAVERLLAEPPTDSALVAVRAAAGAVGDTP
jgi:hypothetical protein